MEEKVTSRILGWNVLTAIGYSFILTIIMGILALIVKAFYPPTVIQIAPIASLIVSPALGIIQLIILALFIAFVSPLRSKVTESNLRQVRKIGIYTSLGYLAFSLLPLAFVVPYIQTYIGLIIAFNVLNGFFGGALATFF